MIHFMFVATHVLEKWFNLLETILNLLYKLDKNLSQCSTQTTTVSVFDILLQTACNKTALPPKWNKNDILDWLSAEN